jgi:hypothetical protein
LTLFHCFQVVIFGRRGLLGVVVFPQMLSFFGVDFLVNYVLEWGGLFRVELLVMDFLQSLSRTGQSFSRKDLDRGTQGRGQSRRNALSQIVRLDVVVVFEVFENVADVQKRIAVQADVHESGLHAREDARDFSFVDTADERKFLLALDVNLD